MKLFVTGLPYLVEETQLRELFAEYGAVDTCHIAKDRETGRSRGFGFVKMPHTKEASHAIQALDGVPWDGRRMGVREALEPGKRPAPQAREAAQ